MFEQTFKNIDDILHKDAGCGSELDYVEQTSWVLFLKYLDDLEKDKATAAELSGKAYTNIINPEFQWTVWATPKDKDGKLDHHKALTGDDLKDFVDLKLFPYLKKFKADAESADTIEYKIGEIFSELKNRIQSGYNLREVINRIDELRFRTHAEKHEMSHLYEDKIKNMGNAGRNGGEYYTPRPLIKTIVKIVAPEIGNKIYDGAVGSAGFLVEAFEYLKHSKKLTTADVATLQKKTFYGKEKKSLAYIIGTMNMILHGVEAPNIVHTNTLAENIADIQEKDRYDIVLANPPFGGKERAEVQQNFPIKTGETASLFLQHFIKILKAGGKAGIVIKNTFLSSADNASVSLRKVLLESCNLHTVLQLPGGTFTGAGVKTIVLFFEKGSSTKRVWFYQLNLDRNLGKGNPLNEKDLAEFVELQKTQEESENSWSIDVKNIDLKTFDLSAKNPNKKEETALRQPQEILEEVKVLDEESAEILKLDFGTYLNDKKAKMPKGWEIKKLRDVCDFQNGFAFKSNTYKETGLPILRITNIQNQELETSELVYFDAKDYKENFDRYKVFKDDLVIAMSGATTGKLGINTSDTVLYLNQRVGKFIPKKELFKPFLYYFLSTKVEESLSIAAGAAQPNLSTEQINNFEIPLPPLSEQKRIVSIIDEAFVAISTAKENAERKLNNLEELKKSVLQLAFSGELEIKKELV